MNDVFTIKDLEFLLKSKDFEGPFISIYFPTRTAGKQKEENAIRYKNMLQQCEKSLAQKNLLQKQIKKLLEPAQNLLINSTFWNHQAGGAAVFIRDRQLKVYRVPFDVKEQVVISDHFHVKPLMELFNANGRFYILALSQNNVELFTAAKFFIEPLELTHAPSDIEQLMQYSVVEEHIQSRNIPQGKIAGSGSIWQGHSVAHDGKVHKREVQQFIQAVSRGIEKQIAASDKTPLVLAGVDFLRTMYHNTNNYPGLLKEGIDGNCELLSAEQLHKQAWKIVEPHFAKALDEILAMYRTFNGTGKVSGNIEQIVANAFSGRVQSLMVDPSENIWGLFDSDTQLASVSKNGEARKDDLLDLAAYYTLSNKGKVYSVNKKQLGGTPAGAIYRY